MSRKDRESLDLALTKMKVNKAYFVSVGPDLSSYKPIDKKGIEKYKLHEIPIDLGFGKGRRLVRWKAERNLYGKLMSIGKAKSKES